jgi:hypothetical protein
VSLLRPVFESCLALVALFTLVGSYDAPVKAFYRAALQAARAHLPSLPLVMSFIPPNDHDVPAFVNTLQAAGGGPIVIDHRETPPYQ